MQKISLLVLTLFAAVPLIPERFVTTDGNVPAEGGHAIGVTTTAASEGEAIAVDVVGTTIVEAGGAIASGQAVQSNASGKAIALTTGIALGTALQAASSDGDRIEILLTPVAPAAVA